MFNIFSRIKQNSKSRDSTTVIIHRLNIPIKLKALSLNEMCIIGLKYAHGNIKDADISAELIIAATTNFNWNDKKLLKEFNSNNGKEVVYKILLTGEVRLLVEKIFILNMKSMLKL